MARLSHLRIAGAPFDAGLALGRFGAAAMHAYRLQSPAWAGVMCWRGSAPAAAMAALVQERFPRIWAELQGLAQGLELPFDEVFLWNCRGDLWALAPDGCTTVQLPGAAGWAIAHNEDGDPRFAGHCALAECAIDGSPPFAAFVYPGSLAGHTFAVTAAGLAMTVNNLRLREADVGVPRMVLTRALLDAPGLPAAVELLQRQPRAGGFHLTLAHRDSAELLSVEFGSRACSVRAVKAPSVHANHALHPTLCERPQLVTGSSGQRQRRGEALLAQAAAAGTSIDPLAILGDAGHPRFPIHRSARDDEDAENTLATALIAVQSAQIVWQVHEHPLQPPVFRMAGAAKLQG